MEKWVQSPYGRHWQCVQYFSLEPSLVLWYANCVHMSTVSKVPAWFTVQTQDAARWVPAIALFSFVWDSSTIILPYFAYSCNTFSTTYSELIIYSQLYIVANGIQSLGTLFCHNWLFLSRYNAVTFLKKTS